MPWAKGSGGKNNEITAIPELLEKIQIKDQVITIDAMGNTKGDGRKDQEKMC
ncbi:MAG: hypothetical protein ACLTKE_07535 [Coprococcus sp.]